MGATLRSNLPKLAAQARVAARAVVIKTIADIKANAQVAAPVDTGYLRASIHGRTTRALGGEVTVGAEYAEYIEYGTSKMAAQPYLTPAAEGARPAFNAAMAQIITGAGGAANVTGHHGWLDLPDGGGE